jgi:hypothetical protein
VHACLLAQHLLGGIDENAKNVHQDSHCPDQHSNQAPSECKSRARPTSLMISILTFIPWQRKVKRFPWNLLIECGRYLMKLNIKKF